jgi:hypothetical protein
VPVSHDVVRLKLSPMEAVGVTSSPAKFMPSRVSDAPPEVAAFTRGCCVMTGPS